MIHNGRADTIPTLLPVLTRLKSVPFIAAGFLLASHYFSIQVCPTHVYIGILFTYIHTVLRLLT